MNKQTGFIKAIIVILMAVGLLVASGISVRDNLNPEEIASTTEEVTEKGENFYNEHLEKPLNTIVITPATIALEHIEEYGVRSVTTWLEIILNN